LQLPQTADHVSLLLVETGVVDRDRDLIRESLEDPFVVFSVTADLVGDSDHADDPGADP
jgi:hypothetical protein